MVLDIIAPPRAGGLPGRPVEGPDSPEDDRPEFESDVPEDEEEEE